MISILIPVYNRDIRPLVNALHQQSETTFDAFEILCFDDASKDSFQKLNQSVNQLAQVTYRTRSKNIGVCRLRNQLAQAAQYNNLLFIDGDMQVNHDDYFKKYYVYLNSRKVVYGGITYPESPPSNDQFLRWKYGKEREEKTAQQRQQTPYLSFMSQNFLAPSSVFEQVRFDERLPYPGHDDTLFGYRLKEQQIPIEHIDNPLEHLGIPNVSDFLTKTDRAIQNLHRILAFPDVNATDFSDHVRVTRTYQKIKKSGFSWFFRSVYFLFHPLLRQLLHASNPSLKLLDLYKLGQLLRQR